MRTPLPLLLIALLIAAFFLVHNLLQIAMAPLAARVLWRQRRRIGPGALALGDEAPPRPLVSIIVPSRNEAATLVDSVRALLAIEYEPCEIIIVSDGSTDATIEVLSSAFDLVAAPVSFTPTIATASIHGCYRSIPEPRLTVIDKDSVGCRADAVNAGINAATGALVLVIDASTVLDPESVTRAVLPFLEDPHTIAVGGNVSITNGCRIEGGRVAALSLPPSWLARYQIIEHMRSFLLFRLACATRNGVLLTSGAVAMFQRRALLAIGGYDTTAIDDDMELTIRLQRFYRERRERFRIVLDPSPLGSTHVPEDGASFQSLRRRRRCGLMRSLWRHRRLIANPAYGVVGLVVMPYLLVFEGLGPLVEIAGYAVMIAAVLAGVVQWPYFVALSAISVLLAMSVTLLAVLISDVTTQRYMQGSDLTRLVGVAAAESLGYRQWVAWLSCITTFQTLTATVSPQRVGKRQEESAPT